MERVRFLLNVLLVATALVTACATPGSSDRAPLRVASDLDNPPFAGFDDEAGPHGREVEMVEELGRLTQRRIEWVRMPFDKLVLAVEAGEVDALCATFGVTPERAQRVAYTRPYFETSIAIVCRSGMNEPRTTAALAGKRVAAAAGTTSQRAVSRHLPDAIGVFENKDELQTDERLLSRAVDAAVMDRPAAEALVKASAGRLVRLDEVLDGESYALAIRLGRDELLDELNAALETMESSGKMRELDARFGLAPER
jgi:polar amino acid transport system substrate-binding protein